MKHKIDPKIDCVFKALLGAEDNRNLLVHFLNAIIGSDIAAPLTNVDILNPYNDKEFLEDKLSIYSGMVNDLKTDKESLQKQLELVTLRLPAARVGFWDRFRRKKE